jgi:arsenate reductase (thioredoxin)
MLRMRRADPPLVLFLCRVNQVGAIMAEAILNHLARGRVRAVSVAGEPCGEIHPYASECLAAHGISPKTLRNASSSASVGSCPPAVHSLITLCELKSHHCPCTAESAARVCARWSTPDPATVIGSAVDQQLAFEEAFATLHSRIRRFLALPLERMSDQALSAELTRIGETL